MSNYEKQEAYNQHLLCTFTIWIQTSVLTLRRHMDAEVRRKGQAMPYVGIKLSAKYSAPSALRLVNIIKMRKFVMLPSWVFTQRPPQMGQCFGHI